MKFSKSYRTRQLAVACYLAITGLLNLEQLLALECKPENNQWVYGANQIVDELMTCSLSRSFDLDLTPHGDRIKPTSKTLVDQGLSNKTTIIHAKLSGLWTGKRPKFVETGWRCSEDETVSTSIIEVSSLSLVVIEKVDMQVHRNQHMLAVHRPCKTLDLPLWMCRQTKPIYRTTTTWVNRAYFNLTLSQRLGETRPTLRQLSPVFTCPETFKQKITHSPSSTYVLARHVQQMASQSTQAKPPPSYQNSQDAPSKMKPATATTAESLAHDTAAVDKSSNVKRSAIRVNGLRSKLLDEPPTISHPSSFTTIQSGQMPASPPYHNSVSLIMSQVREALMVSLNDCIHLTDSDLSLMSDHRSFSSVKYSLKNDDASSDEDTHNNNENSQHDAHGGESADATEEFPYSARNECSDKMLIKSRIELANELSSQKTSPESSDRVSTNVLGGYSKRDQYTARAHSSGPDQLLDPFGLYHGETNGFDAMIDDN